MASKPKSKEFVDDSSDASDGGDEPKRKKTKKVKVKKIEEDDEGPPFELGARKKITVNSFKGKTLIDIREYYDAGGEEKPGKRVEQWKALQKFIPNIEKEIGNK